MSSDYRFLSIPIVYQSKTGYLLTGAWNAIDYSFTFLSVITVFCVFRKHYVSLHSNTVLSDHWFSISRRLTLGKWVCGLCSLSLQRNTNYLHWVYREIARVRCLFILDLCKNINKLPKIHPYTPDVSDCLLLLVFHENKVSNRVFMAWCTCLEL